MVNQRGRSGQIAGTGFSGKQSQLGLRTTKATKKIGCSNLKALIEHDKLIIQDFDIIAELSTYILKGKEKKILGFFNAFDNNLHYLRIFIISFTMRQIDKVNLNEKFSLINDLWTPKIIGELNDYQFKLVKMKGEFVKHQHPETDEVFLVIEGRMNIEFESETIEIKSGEMIVVPKGVEHKPFADEECKVMLVEPRGVLNTGDIKGDLTAPNDQWI